MKVKLTGNDGNSVHKARKTWKIMRDRETSKAFKKSKVEYVMMEKIVLSTAPKLFSGFFSVAHIL